MTKTATVVGASILGALLACAGALAQTAPATQDHRPRDLWRLAHGRAGRSA